MHLQARSNVPTPRQHTRLPTRTQVLNPHGDQTIQDPIPLRMTHSTVVLKSGSLDGRPPQEILIVEVIHGVVKIRVAVPIQTVNDTSVLGIRVNDVGMGMRVPPLVGTRDGDIIDTIGVLGDFRHGDR